MSNQEAKHKRACLEFVIVFLLSPAASQTQTLVATIPVGKHPQAIAVNQTTNKIYVANCPTTANSQPGVNGTVTIVDGETNAMTTLPAGICPVAIAVNPVSNKVYIANEGKFCIIANQCNNAGSVTVIDGATATASQLQLPNNLPHPSGIAVNTSTNKIFVASRADLFVIDGTTNAIDTIAVPNWSYDVAVNPLTNKIFVSSFSSLTPATENAITEIDGATSATTPITDPKAANPVAIAIDPAANKIYVVNLGDTQSSSDPGSITVVDGTTHNVTNLTNTNGFRSHSLDVNPLTNEIFIANGNDTAQTGNGGITELSGASLSVTSIKDPSAVTVCSQLSNKSLAVDPSRDRIYSANCGSNNITVIDGSTNTVVTVTDSSAIEPIAIAINSATNKIYIANASSDNISVISGSAPATTFTLSVGRSGNGRGLIRSQDGFIDCNLIDKPCSAIYPSGTSVSLSAVPSVNSEFITWMGACTGTNPDSCTFTMNSDRSVEATFDSLDFTIQAPMDSLILKRGGQASEVLSFSPLGGFSGAISLVCSVSGLAPMPTCALSPSLVTPGNASTLTVSSAGLSAALMPQSHGSAKSLYSAWLPFGLMGCIVTLGLNRRRMLWSLSLFLAVSTFLLVACGGGSSGPPPPQNYTVTVSATAGAIQHSTTVSVTVQ
jgi:YVTN family beta-propeller protein